DRSPHPARSARARGAALQRVTPSTSNRRRLYSTPYEPYDPSPLALTTRWHGTNRPSRLRAQNEPAARAAPGAPASAASSPYVTTSPRGISRSASAQRSRNGVSYSRSTSTSASDTASPAK